MAPPLRVMPGLDPGIPSVADAASRPGKGLPPMTLWIALAACLAWAVLLLGRGFFWLARAAARAAARLPDPPTWPRVTAVVPARDEAETIGATVASLLAQDYPGE